MVLFGYFAYFFTKKEAFYKKTHKNRKILTCRYLRFAVYLVYENWANVAFSIDKENDYE